MAEAGGKHFLLQYNTHLYHIFTFFYCFLNAVYHNRSLYLISRILCDHNIVSARKRLCLRKAFQCLSSHDDRLAHRFTAENFISLGICTRRAFLNPIPQLLSTATINFMLLLFSFLFCFAGACTCFWLSLSHTRKPAPAALLRLLRRQFAR